MKGLTWHGSGDIRCEAVDDPVTQDDRDAIIKVTSCAICGSDLHLYGGFVPGMHAGDVMGHDPWVRWSRSAGEASRLKVGEGVVVRFTIACGECRQCKWGQFSLCERSNPSGAMQAKQIGYPTAGLFGYSENVRPLPGRTSALSSRYLCRCWPDCCPNGLIDDRSCSSPTFFQPATWPPKTATSSKGRRLPYSAAGRSACLQSDRLFCLALNGSLPLTPCRND